MLNDARPQLSCFLSSQHRFPTALPWLSSFLQCSCRLEKYDVKYDVTVFDVPVNTMYLPQCYRLGWTTFPNTMLSIVFPLVNNVHYLKVLRGTLYLYWLYTVRQCVENHCILDSDFQPSSTVWCQILQCIEIHIYFNIYKCPNYLQNLVRVPQTQNGWKTAKVM